jgi:sphingomyelin phosphodiesterase
LIPTDGPQTTTHLRDTTQVDFSKPLQVSYIGPSITPLTGLNAGYRTYQIDAKTFSVMGAQTYIANMSNSLQWTKPVWQFEYDTREAYSLNAETDTPEGDNHAAQDASLGLNWPREYPLNATFWDLLAQKMLDTSDAGAKSPLLELYELYEAKSSSHPDRRGSGMAEIPEQKVCFLRAGSGFLGRMCRERYGGDARTVRERRFGVR